MSGTLELSVIIPFFNEEGNVERLLAELRDALNEIGVPSEVICIDDGSTDGTSVALAASAIAWHAVQVSTFPQNRGQAAALWWGFHQAQGRWIAMLDGDGQNPPAELRRLWAERESADMVVGRRQHRRDSALRRAMSRIANRSRRVLLGDGIQDTGCSLKIFRREVVGSFLPIRSLYSFLPAFAHSAGWKIRELPVAHRPRVSGTSKYGLRAMAIVPLLDLLALAWLLRRRIPRVSPANCRVHPDR